MQWTTNSRRANCFGVALIAILLAVGVFAQDEPKRVTKSEGVAAIATKVVPAYPPIAKQLRIEGSAELEAVVSEDGTVEKVTILGGNALLTHPAADALKKWKFTPFTSDGKAVKALVPVSIGFKL
jgi:protein TonB